jgi:hypothetical protein
MNRCSGHLLLWMRPALSADAVQMLATFSRRAHEALCKPQLASDKAQLYAPG